ncbi:hypothetical protein TSOC_004521 [Tetrabaena socialis]|uniref:Uncharacterized protein n=1 Tax=Tetrabaena socialis TaxID=47790 RepID=A0A2J8A8S1_9CHLO|nr:hypothetical protein TSOC_004521 [Tetrabaena socialis]|eukprot:PNH08901.1 hypothetical protein TSOC_004521 [Tetrabaena socialis]
MGGAPLPAELSWIMDALGYLPPAPAKQQMEAALGRTLDARHYTFLSATYFNTRDPAKLRFLLAAYDAVDGTNDKNAATAAAAAAAIENDAGPNEQTQTMLAQTFGGGAGDYATHTGEDRALYASGWVEGKWALIKSQCVVCHGTPNLTGAQHGACQRCGRGLCGAHCRRVHEALDHCHLPTNILARQGGAALQTRCCTMGV